MRKILGSISGILLLFQVDAMRMEDYTQELASKFPKNLRPINGYIILNSGLLQTMRSLGVNGNETINGVIEMMMHSVNDRSLGAAIDLLIALFPSAGPTLNAKGTGSILEYVRKAARSCTVNFRKNLKSVNKSAFEKRERKFIVDVVYQMLLKSTNDERQTSLMDINFGTDSRGRALRMPQEPAGHLFNIFRRIENDISILLEESSITTSSSSSSSAHFCTLPENFATDIIWAYAWKVLDKDQMEQLANWLNPSASLSSVAPQYTPTEEKVKSDFDKYMGNSVTPFYPGKNVARYDIVKYRGKAFADCGDTTLRQLTAMLVSKGTGTNLEVDFDRIPKGSPLEEFFRSSDIRQLANDTTMDLRIKWEDIISDHQDKHVIYKKQASEHYFEIKSEWQNFLIALCAVMSEYPQLPTRVQEAADCIIDINTRGREAFKNEHGEFTKEKFIEIFNKLIKIRTDVTFEVVYEEGDFEVNKMTGKTTGKLIVRPVVSSESLESELFIKNNTLIFDCNGGHLELKPIKSELVKQLPEETAGWIEHLYFNPQKATLGFIPTDTYPRISIDQALYPILEYFRRIGSEDQREVNESIDWLFGRYFATISTEKREPLGFLGIKRLISTRDYYLGTIIGKWLPKQELAIDKRKVAYSFLEKYMNQDPTIQLNEHERIIFELCAHVIDHSFVNDNFISAIEFLHTYRSFPEIEQYKNKLSYLSETLMNDKMALKEFIVQKYLLNQNDKADNLLITYMQKLNGLQLNCFIRDLMKYLRKIHEKNIVSTFCGRVTSFLISRLDEISQSYLISDTEFNDGYNKHRNALIALLGLCDFSRIQLGVASQKIKNLIGNLKIKFPHAYIMNEIPSVVKGSNLKVLCNSGYYIKETQTAEQVLYEWISNEEKITPQMAFSLQKVSDDELELLLENIQFANQQAPTKEEILLIISGIGKSRNLEIIQMLFEHWKPICHSLTFADVCNVADFHVSTKETAAKVRELFEKYNEVIPFMIAQKISPHIPADNIVEFVDEIAFQVPGKPSEEEAKTLILDVGTIELLEKLKSMNPELNRLYVLQWVRDFPTLTFIGQKFRALIQLQADIPLRRSQST